MEESALRYAVLVSRPEELKPPEIAKALAAFRKIPIQDAARLARSAWGIAADDLDKDGAAGLRAALREEGVESLVLPRNLVEDLAPLAAAASAEFIPGGLSLALRGGGREKLPWERVRIVAAAGIKQTITTTIKVKEGPSPTQKAVSLGLLMAGLPFPIGGKSREVERKKASTDLFFFLDLCLREPAKRYRVDAQDFNFSCLKARMGYTIAQNFRTLVLETLRLCPGAARNRGSRVLLEDAPVASMGYDSLADLDRESRWLLTLDSLKNP